MFNTGEQAGSNIEFTDHIAKIELVVALDGGEKATVSIDKERI